MMLIRLTGFVSLLLIVLTGDAVAQSSLEFENKEGHYAFTPLPGWKVRVSETSSFIYAPEDGMMDQWDEKVDISLLDANDNQVDEAFDFFINTDFPSAYKKFSVIHQGAENINGLKARWAVFSFSGSGAAEGANENNTVTATLQTLFYLIEKNNVLYFITGITEKSLFENFEPDFRTVIRTLRVLPHD